MKFIICLIILSIQDFIFFRFTERYYCKKNKGNCKNCKCWSCHRMNYLDKYGNLKDF